MEERHAFLKNPTTIICIYYNYTTYINISLDTNQIWAIGQSDSESHSPGIGAMWHNTPVKSVELSCIFLPISVFFLPLVGSH